MLQENSALVSESADDAVCVTVADGQDRLRWDQYVTEHPQSSFFHRFAWGELIQSVYGHLPLYLKAEDMDGRTAGILPLVLVKSPFFGNALISTAFTVGGGILASSEAASNALLEKACKLGQEHNVQYIEVRGGSHIDDWVSKTGTYAGFSKDIPVDEDENLQSVPRKKRADIRKAIKAAQADDLGYAIVDDIDTFYSLYAQSVRNLGTPVLPRKFIAALLKQFPNDVEISVIRSGNGPVAALVSFYHQGVVLPYYAGAGEEARRLHAYDYLYWRQMRHAAEKGCTKFDFGRSKVGTGAFAYKTHWGFDPEPLTYQYHLVKAKTVPDINPNNPKFRLVTKVWQKLPLPVANRLGPVLARNLA